jgi:hypothetical protein
MGVFSSIQNAKFFMGWVRAFWLFFWPLEAKIQNGEWIHFCQKFCMVFSSIFQNDGPKSKNFWVKWGTKHTLILFHKPNQKLVCEMMMDHSIPQTKHPFGGMTPFLILFKYLLMRNEVLMHQLIPF